MPTVNNINSSYNYKVDNPLISPLSKFHGKIIKEMKSVERDSLPQRLLKKIGLCFVAFVGYLTFLLPAAIGLLSNRIWKNNFDNETARKVSATSTVIQNQSNNEKPSLFTDKYGLIVGDEEIENPESSWLLNLALLRDAYAEAEDEETKSQIRFLAANFLNKSAPLHLEMWKKHFDQNPEIVDMFNDMFQTSPFNEWWYHREHVNKEMDYGKSLNQKLLFGETSPLFLTDTKECQSLLELRFTSLDPNLTTGRALSTMKETLQKHFSSTPLNALNKHLEFPFLFDLTDHFDDLKTDGDQDKEATLLARFDQFKTQLKRLRGEIIDQFIINNPHLNKYRKQLNELVEKNTLCLARIESEHITGIKILPTTTEADSYPLNHLVENIKLTGLHIGAVNLRRNELDAFAVREDVHYAVTQEKPPLPFFIEKEDFLMTKFFNRLSTACGSREAIAEVSAAEIGMSKEGFQILVNLIAENPQFRVLVKATTDILEGLLDEITPEKWDELNRDPVRGPLLQTSLKMIQEYLSSAEMDIYGDDFPAFAQKIELAQAEITTLMEFAHPFEEGDFNEIYHREMQSVIPAELHTYYKGALGKTAMNVFAGINSAVKKLNPNPHSVFGDNVYYESQAMIGSDFTLNAFKANPDPPKIDLFVGQFNPNIEVANALTTYKREDVIQNVRDLFEQNKAAEHMTVAIDCTIEQSQSDNIRQILNTFKQEISEGKLNFIFFGSGQKFDMFGMDSYFGSPFFMINNGDRQWKPFDALLTHPVHRTDTLSNQWFCLAYKYASDSLKLYKELIFNNTRYILDRVPETLKPQAGSDQTVTVKGGDADVDLCFIDLKLTGPERSSNSWKLLSLFYKQMVDAKIKIFSRQSFGFLHTCFLVFDLPDSLNATTIRMTPGINPKENDAIVHFLNTIAAGLFSSP